MQITRLATTYRRSIAVTLPDGREAWVAHEAQIEASYEPDEIKSLPEEYANLRKITMKEVSGAIKAEKEHIEKIIQAQAERDAEPFASQDSALSKLPKV